MRFKLFTVSSGALSSRNCVSAGSSDCSETKANPSCYTSDINSNQRFPSATFCGRRQDVCRIHLLGATRLLASSHLTRSTRSATLMRFLPRVCVHAHAELRPMTPHTFVKRQPEPAGGEFCMCQRVFFLEFSGNVCKRYSRDQIYKSLS